MFSKYSGEWWSNSIGWKMGSIGWKIGSSLLWNHPRILSRPHLKNTSLFWDPPNSWIRIKGFRMVFGGFSLLRERDYLLRMNSCVCELNNRSHPQSFLFRTKTHKSSENRCLSTFPRSVRYRSVCLPAGKASWHFMAPKGAFKVVLGNRADLMTSCGSLRDCCPFWNPFFGIKDSFYIVILVKPYGTHWNIVKVHRCILYIYIHIYIYVYIVYIYILRWFPSISKAFQDHVLTMPWPFQNHVPILWYFTAPCPKSAEWVDSAPQCASSRSGLTAVSHVAPWKVRMTSKFPSKLHWLVVWNIFYFPIYWESSSQLTNSYFSEGWPNHQPVSFWDMFYCHVWAPRNFGISFPRCSMVLEYLPTFTSKIAQCG